MPIQVVLADDQATMRSVVRAVLERCGFAVLAEAEDATALVAAALEHEPDVVVTDLQMPGGGGVSAARRIRASLPRTGIVVLSQFSETQYLAEVEAMGAAVYLLKEEVGDIERFAAAVRSVAP